MKKVSVYRGWCTKLKPAGESCLVYRVLESLGWEIVQSKIITDPDDYDHDPNYLNNTFLDDCDLLLVYNGMRDHHEEVAHLAKSKNIKTLYNEVGFLPQDGHETLDPKGLFCKSTLNDKLDWIKPYHIKKSQWYLKQSKYFGRFKYGLKPKKYILLAGQMDWDAQMTACSTLTNMDMISESLKLREKYDFPIVFRPHPRMYYHTPWKIDKNKWDSTGNYGKRYISKIDKLKQFCLDNDVVFYDFERDGKKSFIESASESVLVAGMNSTSLMEAMAIDKPAIGFSNGPVKKHITDLGLTFDPDSRKKLVAAYYFSQYHYQDFDACQKLLIRHGFDYANVAQR